MSEIRSAPPQLINLNAPKLKKAKDIKVCIYSGEINKIPPYKITTENLSLDIDVCYNEYSLIDFLNHISVSIKKKLILHHNNKFCHLTSSFKDKMISFLRFEAPTLENTKCKN